MGRNPIPIFVRVKASVGGGNSARYKPFDLVKDYEPAGL